MGWGCMGEGVGQHGGWSSMKVGQQGPGRRGMGVGLHGVVGVC